ncbi:hypothetical protein H0H81_004805, partial [Sphagnurus paluster]
MSEDEDQGPEPLPKLLRHRPDHVILTAPAYFRQFSVGVTHIEKWVSLLAQMEGVRHRLGNTVIRKLEHFLEFMQPYPGDPLNVLQFHGPRFSATEYLDEFLVYDQVLDVSTPISAAAVYYPGFELGRWYATYCAERAG